MQYQELLLRQPFKLLYLVCFAILLLVRVPYWTLTSLLPSWRPRPAWSLYRTLVLYIMDAAMDAMVQTSTYTILRVDPQKHVATADKDGLVWVDPTPELLVGDIKEYAMQNGVTPVRVAGYWYGDRSPPAPDEKIMYELHGGAFVFGDASPVGYLGNPHLCNEMLRHNLRFTRVFQLEYRLSQGPPLPYENPFPAALIDAVAGYHYLVKVMGFKPSNILVMGESAGGGLAITLVRYLIQHVPSLPPPAALFLMSPGVDWGSSHWGPRSSVTTNRRSDFIGPFFSGYPARAIVGTLPPSELDTNAWISPASKYLAKPNEWFKGFPPTLILVGDAEMLLDSSRTLRDRMRADIGSHLTYLEMPGATHIFLSFTWHEPEKSEGYEKVAKWLSVSM